MPNQNKDFDFIIPPLFPSYYKPLDNIEASNLISKIKTFIPEWVRIQRIQRDVPANIIEAGVDKSNLRQIIEEEIYLPIPGILISSSSLFGIIPS